MKYISILLKNIKNLLPYFLLITIYFFLINLEARKTYKNNRHSEEPNIITHDKNENYDKKLRIKIPVIPYKQ